MDWFFKILETQRNITIVLSTLFLIWILSSTLKNIKEILEGIEQGYLNLLKFIKWILSIVLLPFKLLYRFFKWLFTIKARHDYKKAVLSSVYNVYPEKFKIPWWRKLFSRKIRREAKTRFRCIERCIETQEFINNNMKYITMIETSVRGGKSSLMACLSHVKTLHFKSMTEIKIHDTQKILYLIDWEKINKIIHETYKVDTKIKNIVNKILEDEELNDYFKGKYNNYRQEVPLLTLLQDYVTAICAEISDNYVMSNYRLYNRLTESYNIDLPSNLFDIKTSEGRANYYIPAYSIIVEDELSLTNLKNTSSYRDISKTGRDTSMRVIGHLKKETSFYVGCSQNISRNAKIFTELANSYFAITSLDVVGAQKTYSRVYQKEEQELENKLIKEKEQKKILEIKKQIFKAYQEQKKIYAAGFIKYTVRVATHIKDLEKLDKSNLVEQELYFPMTWGFGTYLRCELNEFDDFLNEYSQRSDSDLKVITSFDEKIDPKRFKEILEEDKEEEETKKKGTKKGN